MRTFYLWLEAEHAGVVEIPATTCPEIVEQRLRREAVTAANERGCECVVTEETGLLGDDDPCGPVIASYRPTRRIA